MSTLTACGSEDSGMPLPGSPGEATMGESAAQSRRIVATYVAPASLHIHGSGVNQPGFNAILGGRLVW